MRKRIFRRFCGTLVFMITFVNIIVAQVGQVARIQGSPFPSSIVPDTLFNIIDSNFTESELLTISTLQGVLAKGKPVIYRNHGTGYSLWLDDIRANYPVVVDDRFSSDFDGLISNFKNRISGYILCNLHDNSSNTAISLCGLVNAVAITPDRVGAMQHLGIELIKDVRLYDESWVFNNYKDQLSTQIISYQKEGKDLFLTDYSVFSDAFHFFDNIGSYMTNQAFSRMDDNSVMLGWGEDEYQTVELASKNSVLVNAADWVLNLSALSNFNAETVQQNHLDTAIAEENVHTVCFLMTDGDNVQWLLNDFAAHQNWYASPDRGKLDLGWTISPALCELAPTVMKYLYDRSSDSENGRDYFVAGPSGVGYFFPEKYPALESMTSQLNNYMKKSDLNIVNIIGDNGNLEPIKPYLDQDAVDGIFLYTYSDNYIGLHGSIQWYNGKPVIGGRFALWDGVYSPQSLAAVLNGMPTNPKSPDGYSLIPVHVWSANVSDVKTCADLLNTNVRVVAPDEFVKLIKANLGDQPTSSKDISKKKEDAAKLYQNYPNPTVGSTTIGYFLSERADEVSLSVYNMNGQMVKLLTKSEQPKGWHNIEMNIQGFEPGVYIYKLNVDGDSGQLSKSMMVR